MTRSTSGQRQRGAPVCVDDFIEDVPTSVDHFIEEPELVEPDHAPSGYSDFLEFLGKPIVDEQLDKRPCWGCPVCSLGNTRLDTVCESCYVDRNTDQTSSVRGDGDSVSSVELEESCADKDDSNEEDCGDILFPTFNSEEQLYRDENTSDVYVAMHYRKRLYMAAFTILFFMLSIACLVYYSTGYKNEPLHANSIALVKLNGIHATAPATDEDEPTTNQQPFSYNVTTAPHDGGEHSSQHTHPQMHHTHARHTPSPTTVPTSAPSTRKHTHPLKDHKLRHSEAPTRRHHTHVKKDHPVRGPADVHAEPGRATKTKKADPI